MLKRWRIYLGIGAKPAAVCRWIFTLLGACPGDTLHDLFPGSGAFGRAWAAYTSSPELFCWEDGRPPHPDTITRRFKQLAAAAGLPEIDLHDVRRYATAGQLVLDAKIDWKALSRRIGHADVAFTMKQYVQTDLEADRKVANTLAELIIGGARASTEIADEDQGGAVAGYPDEAA
jgi:hypothetical protein